MWSCELHDLDWGEWGGGEMRWWLADKTIWKTISTIVLYIFTIHRDSHPTLLLHSLTHKHKQRNLVITLRTNKKKKKNFSFYKLQAEGVMK